MSELELARGANDRRLYRLAGIGTVRLEGWFARGGSAETDDGRSWGFSRRGLLGRVVEATDVTGAAVGRFTPRTIRRGGELCWGTRRLELQTIGMRAVTCYARPIASWPTWTREGGASVR